jgi:hypothetical protein
MTPTYRHQALFLPLLNALATLDFDPNNCHERIAKTIPISSINPTGDVTNYVHKSAHINIGSIQLSVGLGSPFEFWVDDHDSPSLLLSTGGNAQIQVGHHTYRCNPSAPAIFLAGESYSCQITDANGIELRLDRQKLAQQAMVMAERLGLDGLDCSRLFRPLEMKSDTPSSAGLHSMLTRSLHYLDVSGADVSNYALARIEALIYQLLAAFVYPELLVAV